LSDRKKILLGFYGDDFTGSTDALEFICRAGAKTILFIDPPTADDLKRFPGLDAFGVAGKTRSLSADEMEKELMQAFKLMKATGAKHIHYKICSTFDSSPAIGSIGKAIDCGATIFENTIVPVLGGMPELGRYCVFGNLFARMGIGSNGNIYRLDRHPSMSQHPVTPAEESDLIAHLSRQTNRKMGLVDVLQLSGNNEGINCAVGGLIGKQCDVVLFDTLYPEHLLKIGEYMDEFAVKSEQTFFSVGSSGIEMALGKFWNHSGLLSPNATWSMPARAKPLLVISGSCSPVTAGQIAWAKSNGFSEVVLDAAKICNETIVEQSVVSEIEEMLRQKNDLIVHTGIKQPKNLSSEKLGTALGNIARRAVETSGVKRVIIAGGDTSSYAARAMEIDAVEMTAPLVSGAPLCRAYSNNKAIDGLEVNFKGGQVGPDDYFGIARYDG
jgi:uncharacterized protein YgbK (DUF1537 family)